MSRALFIRRIVCLLQKGMGKYLNKTCAVSRIPSQKFSADRGEGDDKSTSFWWGDLSRGKGFVLNLRNIEG